MLLGRWSYRFRLDQSFSRRWSHWTKVSFPRVAMPSFSNRRQHLTRPDGLVCWISFCRQLSNGLQVDVRVGYYTSVYGLGRHPSDTKVLGRHTEVFALLSYLFFQWNSGGLIILIMFHVDLWSPFDPMKVFMFWWLSGTRKPVVPASQVRSLTSTNESPHPELGSLQNFWRSAENLHTGAASRFRFLNQLWSYIIYIYIYIIYIIYYIYIHNVMSCYMLATQCHKPSIWGWNPTHFMVILEIFGDGVLLGLPH